MKGHISTGLKVTTLLLASVAFGFAQTSSMSVNGAYPPYPNTYNPNTYNQVPRQVAPVGPGTVNYVEGQVSLNGRNLAPESIGSAALKPGQTLDTGNGYAEVLLTPGAFLRVGNNSEVQILSSGLANTKVQLDRGEGLIEVDQLIKGAHVAVAMNGATAEIEKTGLYEFDSNQQAIRVLKGKAEVSSDSGNRTLGEHDEVLLASKHPLKKRSFDESLVKRTPLYVWSATRSETESQASQMAAANASYYDVVGPGWYWDPAFDFYGFWPFEASLYGPFGWGFYSPAFFGYYGGYGLGYGYPIGVYPHRWYGHPGFQSRLGIGARVNGFHGGMVRAPATGGFRGGVGGFHGGFAGGGFHGGGFAGGRR